MFNEHDCGCKAEIVIVVNLRISKQKKLKSNDTTKNLLIRKSASRFLLSASLFALYLKHIFFNTFLFFRFILDISN